MIRRWFKNRLAKAYLGIVICMFIILFLLAGCASTPVTEVLIKTKPIEIVIDFKKDVYKKALEELIPIIKN